MANWLSTLRITIFIYSHLFTVHFCLEKADKSNKAESPPQSSPIVGNYRKARDEEFPYLVMISEVKDNNWILCAGTLIKADWVLTARHCILHFAWNSSHPMKLREVVVTPKYHNKRSMLNGTKKYNVSKMFCNHVTKDGQDSLTSDVALLKLDQPVPISQSKYHLKTVKMVERSDQIDWSLKFRVPGWGSNKRGSNVGRKDYPDDLLVIDPYYHRTCNFYSEYAKPQTFCVGNKDLTMSFGDDGGPAIARDDKTDEDLQAGIYTRGMNVLGMMNGPSLFANVTYFGTWILNTMVYEPPDDECKNVYGI